MQMNQCSFLWINFISASSTKRKGCQRQSVPRAVASVACQLKQMWQEHSNRQFDTGLSAPRAKDRELPNKNLARKPSRLNPRSIQLPCYCTHTSVSFREFAPPRILAVGGQNLAGKSIFAQFWSNKGDLQTLILVIGEQWSDCISIVIYNGKDSFELWTQT